MRAWLGLVALAACSQRTSPPPFIGSTAPIEQPAARERTGVRASPPPPPAVHAPTTSTVDLDVMPYTCGKPQPRTTPQALPVSITAVNSTLPNHDRWLAAVPHCELGALGYVSIVPSSTTIDVRVELKDIVQTPHLVRCDVEIVVSGVQHGPLRFSGHATASTQLANEPGGVADCVEGSLSNLVTRVDATLSQQTVGWQPWPASPSPPPVVAPGPQPKP